MALAPVIEDVLGGNLSIGVEAYDGSSAGPKDAPAVLQIHSPDALRRVLTAPGELGFARAYIAGELDFHGDIFSVLEFRQRLPKVRMGVGDARLLVRELGGWRKIRRLPPPPEEVRLGGWRHSAARDKSAISHHYDVSNAFYRMMLGPTLTYSCAVFNGSSDSLEQSQTNKHELVCRKLGLRDGDRLLDVGCGWGSTILHAAQSSGVTAVGVTISEQQAELATKRVMEAGVADRVEIRVQDYRDVNDGPYDAIASIGMFEHVGRAKLATYFTQLFSLLRPGGRLLNHGISYLPGMRARLPRRSFVNRYVFPDAELHEIGSVISAIQRVGFEVRHAESLREHYTLTLRRWVANLDQRWAEVVDEVGEGRARVWRLAMAGASINFARGPMQVHQVLGVRSHADGRSEFPLRPTFT